MGKRRAKKKRVNQYFIPLVIVLGVLIIAYASILSFKGKFSNLNNSVPHSGLSSNSVIAPNEINNGPITPGSLNYNATLSSLFPKEGFKTKIVLGNVIPKLVSSGALNLSKVKVLYGKNLTQQELDLLTKPDYSYLNLTSQNANFLLLVLWPLGIANKNPILDNFSAKSDVSNLASTGGWTLGTQGAMTYFDKLQLINLTSAQQSIVRDAALSTYRPCCNNPTGFPDCNHGAALLALEELGASQGLNKTEVYNLALEAQTLWFPSYYYDTALSLEHNNVSYWNNSRAVLGVTYSSASGWYRNVYTPLKNNNLLPPSTNGCASCGV